MFIQLSWTNLWRLLRNSPAISPPGTSFESLASLQVMLVKQTSRPVRDSKWVVPSGQGNVTVDEMKASQQEIVKAVQKKLFPKEVKQLAEANPDDGATVKSVDKSSSIRCLYAIMRDGLLRVGGHLRHASITELILRTLLFCQRKAMSLT